jgi:hypothetical protein
MWCIRYSRADTWCEPRHGDVIDCIIGDPVEGLHLRVVVDWKQRLGPICVSIVWKHRATPCRHDGGAIEEAA